MPKKLTQEEYLNKCKAAHGDKYDLSTIVYVNDGTKINVRCYEHGNFTKLPGHFSKGSGCAKCAYASNAAKATMQHDTFVSRSQEVHKDMYDYTKAEYKHGRSKVCVHCKACNVDFFITPEAHLLGQGCRTCGYARNSVAKRYNFDKFVLEANAVHNDKFDYSLVRWKGVKTKIKLKCPAHNLDFEVIPADHVRGSDCPECSVNGGYRSCNSGYLYVLTDGALTKVGITNKPVWIRAEYLSKTAQRKFIILKEFWFEDGKAPLNIETKLLKEMRHIYRNPAYKFNGYSECFIDCDQAALLNRIEELIQEYTDTQNQEV